MATASIEPEPTTADSQSTAQGDQELDSLPLHSHADSSRNDISDIGLMILANSDRVRDDPEPLSEVTLSHSVQSAPDAVTAYQHAFTNGGDRIGGGDASCAPGAMSLDRGVRNAALAAQRNAPTTTTSRDDVASSRAADNDFENFDFGGQVANADAAADDDENDLIVPADGLYAGQQPPFKDTATSLRNNETDRLLASMPGLPSFAGERNVGRDESPVLPEMTPIASEDDSGAHQRRSAIGLDHRASASRASEARRVHPSQYAFDDEDDGEQPSQYATPHRSEDLGSQDSVTEESRSATTASTRRRHRRSSSSRNDKRRSRHSNEDDGDDDEDDEQSARSQASSSRSTTASRRHRRHRSSAAKEPRREQTYAEYQEEIRRKVKQQQDMEKREMLLLFYEKQRYDNVQVPKKFFEQGLNSDLYEMRWWYYKLIRDTRINDAVSSMKHNIVQGARMALFLNSTIGNPLNLRLDNDFPSELGNRLNTSTDRHLREYVKSKCGVGGPKPNPVRHIVQDIFECGWNYHRNKMAMEESDKRKNGQRSAEPPKAAGKPPASTFGSSAAPPPPAPDAYNMLREMANTRSSSAATQQQQQQHVAQQAQYELYLQQQRMMQQQQAMMQQQQQQQHMQQRAAAGAPPVFQPNRQPLRNVFRNMTPDMRRAPMPDHLRPPTPRMSANGAAGNGEASLSGTQSLAAAAQAMREQIQMQTSRAGINATSAPPPPPSVGRAPPMPTRSATPTARLQRPTMSPVISVSGDASQKKKVSNRALSSSQAVAGRDAPNLNTPNAALVPLPPTSRSFQPPQSSQRLARLPTRVLTHAQPPMGRPNLFDVAAARPPPLRPPSSAFIAQTQPLSSIPTGRAAGQQRQREEQRIVQQLAPQQASVAVGTHDNVVSPPTVFETPLAAELESHRAQRQQQMESEAASAMPGEPVDMASLRSDAATSVGGGKRSLDDLMSELQEAYDQDDDEASEILRDDDLSREAARVSGMPDMNTQDKLTDALALMENFNDGNVQTTSSATQRPTLYDLDDVLAEQAAATGRENVQVNEISLESLRRSIADDAQQQQSASTSALSTSRRSRKSGGRRRKQVSAPDTAVSSAATGRADTDLNNKQTTGDNGAGIATERSVTPPPSSSARRPDATTPPPNDAALAGGIKMVAQHKRGRSGLKQFQWSSSPNAGHVP